MKKFGHTERIKIGFVASSGGHWEELMCLKQIADSNETFYVTEKGGQAQDFKNDKLYLFPQINRKERLFVPKFIGLMIGSLKTIITERPKVLISTGALLSVPFCVWGKLCGAKIIYIESFARVEDASMTGKIMYRWADLFLVQWESMLKVYPKAKFVGGIF